MPPLSPSSGTASHDPQPADGEGIARERLPIIPGSESLRRRRHDGWTAPRFCALGARVLGWGRRRYRSVVLNPTDATLATYESKAEAYLAGSPGTVAPAVASLLDAVAERVPGGRVLELGSGPGREASYLETRGVTVDRTDGTLAFVQRLQRGGHEARLLDARSRDFGGPYDAVVANAVLLHLGRADFAQALRACHAATRPGGVLAITLKEGDGERWSDAKVAAPRWFVYWRPRPLREVLERTGWTVVTLDRVQGRLEPWLYVMCRKPAVGQ